MGLDMYLSRAPRYYDTTINQIDIISNYLDWKNSKSAQECTLKEWCGIDEKRLPPPATIEYYKQHYTTKYYPWDTKKEYGVNMICEEVGYWRKANAIHKWFVDNVQDGEDDCGSYEVDREQLERLLHLCHLVKKHSKLVEGRVANGYHFEGYEKVYDYEDGMIIEDPSVAMMHLPTQSGFFFGSTGYDEYYLEDIEDTIEILTNVLETTDFETQMIAYSSSW